MNKYKQIVSIRSCTTRGEQMTGWLEMPENSKRASIMVQVCEANFPRKLSAPAALLQSFTTRGNRGKSGLIEINSKESCPFLLRPDSSWVSVGGTVYVLATVGLSYGKWHQNLVLVIIDPSLRALCFVVVWGLQLLLLSVDLVSAPCCAGPGGNRPLRGR